MVDYGGRNLGRFDLPPYVGLQLSHGRTQDVRHRKIDTPYKAARGTDLCLHAGRVTKVDQCGQNPRLACERPSGLVMVRHGLGDLEGHIPTLA